ncbi:unnamed protein product [Pleuronectes platessa]|uniref:Uncharacterized protein n=1 Tax=Pleuronectes platessa TaxID=8262 RepID=A0A9N7YFN8_PLEPL|nr:unnamed protein product [Pleuronectes platessa]
MAISDTKAAPQQLISIFSVSREGGHCVPVPLYPSQFPIETLKGPLRGPVFGCAAHLQRGNYGPILKPSSCQGREAGTQSGCDRGSQWLRACEDAIATQSPFSVSRLAPTQALIYDALTAISTAETIELRYLCVHLLAPGSAGKPRRRGPGSRTLCWSLSDAMWNAPSFPAQLPSDKGENITGKDLGPHILFGMTGMTGPE